MARKKMLRSMTPEELEAEEKRLRDDIAASGKASRARLELLEAEKMKRAERVKAEQLRVAARALALIDQHPELLDFLANKHTPGRYGSTCSDQNPVRGTEFDAGAKDHWCKRCLLLEAINQPDWCRIKFEFNFSVMFTTNVGSTGEAGVF